MRVAVKSVDTYRKAKSEGSTLFQIDAESRNLGERRGLETLVVRDVNNES